MPGLVPGIHVFLVSYCEQGVVGRDISAFTRVLPGHDDGEAGEKA
jgi:hypothetical protein